uniref:Uncharacterized protein n=1 Tax=Anguilla anguilla TaxID=7936 RepID=A0A0E9XP20_ANGAN
MVPIDARQSMFEEPSRGSKQTTYLPLLSGSTMMALSSSSETSTQEVKDDLIMLMTKSLERMSSFLTWSPVTLVLPAMP